MNVLKSLRSRYVRLKKQVQFAYSIRNLDFEPARILALIRYFETTLGGSISYRNMLPTASNNEAWPWYTYPAIEYLSQYDFSGCAVFEYGSGNSSKFWAQRAVTVKSVESNQTWYETVKSDLAENQDVLLFSDKNDYVNSIHSNNQSFDVIVIDGFYRYNCALESVKCLNAGGMIILDNSDWYPSTARILRENDFLQTDFIGWGPINSYAWCTSIFTKGNTKIPRRTTESILVLDGIFQVGEDDRFII
jgi:hypothetical protein